MVARAPAVLGLSATTWDVIATIFTGIGILIAAIAAAVALQQYGLSRKLRNEQSRPYMVVSAEPGETSPSIVDLVFRNIGATPARSLTIAVDPPFARANEVPEYPVMGAKLFTETIRMWPPGQQRRIFLDSHIERGGKNLPPEHTVTFTYLVTEVPDQRRWWRSRNREARAAREARERLTVVEEYIVDLELTKGAMHATVYGLHHAAEALREIKKIMAKS